MPGRYCRHAHICVGTSPSVLLPKTTPCPIRRPRLPSRLTDAARRRALRPGAAHESHRTGAERWPGKPLVVFGLAECRQATKQTVHLIVDPGREEEAVLRARGLAVTKRDTPEPLDLDRASIRLSARTLDLSGAPVVRVDVAGAEVPDQEVAGELTEIVRGNRESPGGVQLPVPDQPFQQLAFGAEDIYEAIARPAEVVMLVRLLLGISDVDPVPDALDAERRK